MPLLQKALSACVAAVLPIASAFALAQDAGQEPPRADARAKAPNAAPAQNALPNPAAMKQLLKNWEKQSAKLKTLQVAIYRIDRSLEWGEDHYQGSAAFQTPQLASVDFQKIKTQRNAKGKLEPVVKNGKRDTIPFETLVMTGDEVWDYKWDSQQIFIYPLPKDQDKRKIEGGPLPFLFNMKADEAEKRYHMTLLAQNATQYLIRVEPRLDQDKEDFCKAFVVLDAKYLLPLQIKLVSPDKKSTRDYTLSDRKANMPINPSRFQGIVPSKSWKVVRNDPNKPDIQPKPVRFGDRSKPATR